MLSDHTGGHFEGWLFDKTVGSIVGEERFQFLAEGGIGATLGGHERGALGLGMLQSGVIELLQPARAFELSLSIPLVHRSSLRLFSGGFFPRLVVVFVRVFGCVFIRIADGFVGKRAAEPGFGKSPVALDGLGRYFESLGRFFDFESAEKTQLDNLALPRIEHGKLGQGLVERHDVAIFFWGHDERFIEGNLHGSSAALLIISRAREIGEDAAHHARRNREEVGAILPVDRVDVDQAKVDLVDQGCSLQSVTGPLSGHAAVSEAMKLLLDDRR